MFLKLWKGLTNNLFFKVIALFIAVATWLFVSNEIKKENYQNKPAAEVFPSFGKMKSQRLYIKPIFVGQPPDGYELVLNDVKADPDSFVIAGPPLIFEGVEGIETEPIDLSKQKKSIVFEAKIVPIAPSVDTDKLTVKVTIPIRKKEPGVPEGANLP